MPIRSFHSDFSSLCLALHLVSGALSTSPIEKGEPTRNLPAGPKTSHLTFVLVTLHLIQKFKASGYNLSHIVYLMPVSVFLSCVLNSVWTIKRNICPTFFFCRFTRASWTGWPVNVRRAKPQVYNSDKLQMIRDF